MHRSCDDNKWNVNDFLEINDSKRETNKIRPNIFLQSRSTRSSLETPSWKEIVGQNSKADGVNNIPWKRQPSKHTQKENQIEKKKGKIKKTKPPPKKKKK